MPTPILVNDCNEAVHEYVVVHFCFLFSSCLLNVKG